MRQSVHNAENMDLELIRRALKKPGKSRSGLARALHRNPTVVTNILKGVRDIKAREVPVIMEYLELDGTEALTPVSIEPILKVSADAPSALETIKSTLDRIAELERRMAAVENEMRAIGGLRPKKR